MTRAALFIGVKQTGDLPVLRDAVESAKRLRQEWGSNQLQPAELITDENGPVTADMVQSAVERLLQPGNVEQFFVYFAGHGVNIRKNEYWLLTDAPRRTQAAVNVSGSEYLARYCGVPHVVFISDACRTAADTINAQNVSGTDIFPNEALTDTERPVDLFYACCLGRPAHEVRDLAAASGKFKGVYTAVLRRALCFEEPSIIDWSPEGSEEIGYVRPRKLRDFLKKAVPLELDASGVGRTVVQVPDAHISSDPEAWLSRTNRRPVRAPSPPALAPAVSPTPPPLGDRSGRVRSTKSFKMVQKPPSTPRSVLRQALHDPNWLLSLGTHDRLLDDRADAELRTGFLLQGARLAGAISRVPAEVHGPDQNRVRVETKSSDAQVLMVLADGTGVTLPAIPDFVGSLRFENSELVDVAYRPSPKSHRFHAFEHSRRDLESLRKVIADASLEGSFQLEGDDALELARRMQRNKALDPSLAIYAAHAYYELHRGDLIQEMLGYLANDLGAAPFDVAMLAGRLDRLPLSKHRHLLGFAPLLSQGWSHLRARRVELPEGLTKLQETVTQSLWTLYRAEGVELLRKTVFREAREWQLV